jgi:hypothetical protein
MNLDEHKQRMLAFARKQKKVNKLNVRREVTTSDNLLEQLQRSLDILHTHGTKKER